MKISICIPTYNRPNFLKEAIESCLHQTLHPYEIIIGDDSINSESKDLIQEYILPNNNLIKIRYFKNIPSLGQLANVDSLIQKSSGDTLVLLHDDDTLLPKALEIMADCFEKNKDVDAVFGKQYLIEEGGEIKYKLSENLNKHYYREANFEGSVLSSIDAALVQQFPNDCFMVKTGIAKELGYGKKEEVGNAGDFDFGFRLGLHNCKFYFIDQYTANYRLSKQSVGRGHSLDDAAYYTYKLVDQMTYKKSSNTDFRSLVLRKKAPIAIVQANQKGLKKEAFKFYFSKYHLEKIFSLGGIKRLWILLFD